MQTITIDPEFKALIPALSAQEREQLEANIARDGCRDPLVLWGEVLIDGHNRYEICTRLDLPYSTTQVAGVESRDDAKLWVLKNQLGRRNLTDYQRVQLALQAKPLIEAKARANQLSTLKQGNTVPQISSERAPIETRNEVGAMAGVSHDTVRKVEKIEEKGSAELKQAVLSGELSINLASDLADLEAEQQKAVVIGGKSSAQAASKAIRTAKAQEKKEKRRADLDEQAKAIAGGELEQPAGLFDVIAIDPPWNYGREYDPDTSRVANPYPEMTQEQIKQIDLPSKDDAILFLWTTHQFIFDAKELLDHWGFAYKATMVWDKEHIGMGSWLRMQCEFCLIGVKGSPFWDNTKHRDILREARREHSRKPDSFYTLVESVTAGRRIEYFSRQARNGWEVFGNDTAKF